VTVRPVLRFILTIAGSLAYLGLAVLGWGGPAGFFAQPARVALAIVLGVLAVAAFFAGGNISPGVREDRGNRWVIPVFAAIGVATGFLSPWTDRAGILVLDGEPLRWLGVALFAAGGALRLWPVYVLGDRFSGLVAIQRGHTLATGGIYGVIRHPSYLGLLVNALGWALAFRSGIGVILAAALTPPLIARMRAEERLLQAEFGAPYDSYRTRTWMLVPGVY
jgi:protein-S-isoprenylcysteine O-methyltransferase Ste14